MAMEKWILVLGTHSQFNFEMSSTICCAKFSPNQPVFTRWSLHLSLLQIYSHTSQYLAQPNHGNALFWMNALYTPCSARNQPTRRSPCLITFSCIILLVLLKASDWPGSTH